MNTITLPRSRYMEILDTQEKFRSDLERLQNVVSYIAQDEVSPAYITKLYKIEKGLSAGKGIKFKNKGEINKFFKSL